MQSRADRSHRRSSSRSRALRAGAAETGRPVTRAHGCDVRGLGVQGSGVGVRLGVTAAAGPLPAGPRCGTGHRRQEWGRRGRARAGLPAKPPVPRSGCQRPDRLTRRQQHPPDFRQRAAFTFAVTAVPGRLEAFMVKGFSVDKSELSQTLLGGQFASAIAAAHGAVQHCGASPSPPV